MGVDIAFNIYSLVSQDSQLIDGKGLEKSIVYPLVLTIITFLWQIAFTHLNFEY